MGFFEAKFLEHYLSENYEVNTIDTDLSLIEKFINFDSFKDIRDKYSDIIEPKWREGVKILIIGYYDPTVRKSIAKRETKLLYKNLTKVIN